MRERSLTVKDEDLLASSSLWSSQGDISLLPLDLLGQVSAVSPAERKNCTSAAIHICLSSCVRQTRVTQDTVGLSQVESALGWLSANIRAGPTAGNNTCWGDLGHWAQGGKR